MNRFDQHGLEISLFGLYLIITYIQCKKSKINPKLCSVEVSVQSNLFLNLKKKRYIFFKIRNLYKNHTLGLQKRQGMHLYNTCSMLKLKNLNQVCKGCIAKNICLLLRHLAALHCQSFFYYYVNNIFRVVRLGALRFGPYAQNSKKIMFYLNKRQLYQACPMTRVYFFRYRLYVSYTNDIVGL